MAPSDYQLEITVILSSSENKYKSIAVASVMAEANFANVAGQNARYRALKARSANVLKVVKQYENSQTNVLAKDTDGYAIWKQYYSDGLQQTFISGLLTGILLIRAETETLAHPSEAGFRVGQVRTSMNEMLNGMETDTSLLYVYLMAEKALRERATTK